MNKEGPIYRETTGQKARENQRSEVILLSLLKVENVLLVKSEERASSYFSDGEDTSFSYAKIQKARALVIQKWENMYLLF